MPTAQKKPEVCIHASVPSKKYYIIMFFNRDASCEMKRDRSLQTTPVKDSIYEEIGLSTIENKCANNSK